MFGAIIDGFGLIVRRPGLVLLLYFINLFAAILCIAPLWLFLSEITAERVVELLPGGPFGAAFTGEILARHSEALFPAVLLVAIVACLYMIIGRFVSMGVFCVADRPEGSLIAIFLGGIGAWFWPMVRLLLLCVPLFICIGLLAYPAMRLVTAYIPDPGFYHLVPAAVLGPAAGLFVLGRVMDYAQLHALSRNQPNMSRALSRGILFIFRYAYAVWPMALFFAGFTAAVSLGFTFLIQRPELAGFSLILVQVHMLTRLAGRVAFFGGEWSLYDRYLPAAPRLMRDGDEPPVRRGSGFWERNEDMEKNLVRSAPEQKPDAPKTYTL
ncbi:MAG: hypothetical protein QNK37_30215 [Acidobacteriota bacterium]|nr:hypothetical protein [Acidobacteriota bacterium]